MTKVQKDGRSVIYMGKKRKYNIRIIDIFKEEGRNIDLDQS